MQNIEKTIQAILKKFEIKDDYEKRKLVFWYDKDSTVEDEEELEQIKSSLGENGKKLHILNNNFFETKKLLEKDDTQSDYLIYSPNAERDHKSNWLLDIQLYSSRFENSKISDIKSELGIEGYDLDKLLEEHGKFFTNKDRVSAFKRHYQNDWKEDKFVLGMLAALSRSRTIDQKEIVRNLLLGSLDEEKNTIWGEFERFGLVDKFWNMIHRRFGYSSEHPTLKKLFLSFIITHISRNTKVKLKSYQQYINRSSNECEIFIRGWMDHSRDSKIFDNYCHQLLSEDGAKLKNSLTSLLDKHQVEDYLEAESVDVFDKIIIVTIVKELNDGSDNFEKYLGWIDKRKTKHWYQVYGNIYCAIENAIHLHQFSKDIEQEGIREQSLNELFKAYTKRYYHIDYYYRKFYFHYDKDSEKDILKNDIKEKVEKLYAHLLNRLLTKWSDLITSELEDTWDIELIDNQKEFYDIYVDNIIRKNDRDKVAVIISDGLRYENAVELKEVLNNSTKGTLELKAIASSLPSYTKLGMASLLPNNRFEYMNNHIFVDGIDSEGTENRGKILSKGYPDSLAINFRDLMEPKTDDARDKIKGKRVIFIYHNRIDDTGDKISSEHKVFDAVESTIQDIDKMVNRLGRSLNVTKVIITSDHGFIYKREQLESVDKLETQSFDRNRINESNKRFIITEQDIELLNTHKFSMAPLVNSDKQMYLYVPLGDLRFKSQGGGVNYVHGGSSLQETVIPVLVYNHIRYNEDLDRKGIEHGKVEITVLESHKKITSRTFKVRLLQTGKVTDKRESLSCNIALYDFDGHKVSDEKLLIADSTSDEPEERIKEVILTLSSDIENKTYNLIGKDDDPKALQQIFEIPMAVDILITDDF
jgi:uncharacterized protein (TIGR02687 family)